MYFDKSKMTEEMTIALAHEVKNPLALIKANIELLELEEYANPYKSNFKVIKKEINKISALISDFMLFCKPLKDMEQDEIFIFDILEDTLERYKIYENIKFYFNCYCSFEEMSILGEETKLTLLLNNIYKNSIEAILENGIIQTTVYKDGENLIIDIVDNGTGIEKSILDKIYEPFFTNKEQGSGLGLPICKSIMQHMGGSFDIFNNKEKGCTVRLKFKSFKA